MGKTIGFLERITHLVIFCLSCISLYSQQAKKEINFESLNSIALVAPRVVTNGFVEVISSVESVIDEELRDALKDIEHTHGWSSEVSVSEEPLTIKVDDMSFTFRGDTADSGQIFIDIAGHKKTLVYRF